MISGWSPLGCGNAALRDQLARGRERERRTCRPRACRRGASRGACAGRPAPTARRCQGSSWPEWIIAPSSRLLDRVAGCGRAFLLGVALPVDHARTGAGSASAKRTKASTTRDMIGGLAPPDRVGWRAVARGEPFAHRASRATSTSRVRSGSSPPLPIPVQVEDFSYRSAPAPALIGAGRIDEAVADHPFARLRAPAGSVSTWSARAAANSSASALAFQPSSRRMQQ